MRIIQLHPKPLLSVLICHLPDRKEKLNRLLNQIYGQAKDYPIEILVNDGEGSTGGKRNECLEQAVGEYCNFFDDDDEIVNSYYDKVFPYLSGEICSVGYNLSLRANEKHLLKILCCAAVTENRQFSTTIWRPITHICIFKKELAVKFPDTVHGEDVYWHKEMIPILKNKPSAFIDEILYYYNVHESVD